LKSFVYVSPKQLAHVPNTLFEIKIDISIGATCLVDNFEWDAAHDENDGSIEKFAHKTCAELALGGEFVNALVYSMRSQIYNFRTAILNLSTSDDLSRAESRLRIVPYSTNSIFRCAEELEIFSPKIQFITEEDMQKKMKISDRTARRSRRSLYSGY